MRLAAGELTVLRATRARKAGEAVPTRLPARTPLFHVRRDFIKIFDRDLAAATAAAGLGWCCVSLEWPEE